MRKLIVLAFVLTSAACGSKKSPKSPANTQTEAAPGEGSGSGSDATSPAPAGGEGGGGTMQSSDPCEGGQ